MNALTRQAFVPAHVLVPDSAVAAGQIMAVASSVAQELSDRWPFAVARLRVSVSGPVCRRGACPALTRAILLGLSGIVEGDSAARVDGALGLQRRMLAIRLAGRKLVAFHPDRDLDVSQGPVGRWTDRLRVDALDSGGRVLGSVERMSVPLSERQRLSVTVEEAAAVPGREPPEPGQQIVCRLIG